MHIGSRLELFVDEFLIESMSGVRLRLHEPQYAGSVLRFNALWEGAFCGYGSVLCDNGIFRLYYRGWPEQSSEQVTCYAESCDGIVFEKPILGLCEVAGSLNNNVLLDGFEYPATHNFSPFIDTKPGVPESERYKAVGGLFRSGLIAYVSGDGVRWRKLKLQPIITDGVFDSQNVVFWSEHEKCYVCYLRKWGRLTHPGGSSESTIIRTIGRTTSEDFRVWTPTELMQFGSTPYENLYTNQTIPYYRAPHVYLAFPMRFVPDLRVLTSTQARKLGVVCGYRKGCADVAFMSSRGGLHYDRIFMESFIRPGMDYGNWSSRAGQLVYGMVQTSKTELSLYKQEHYAQSTSHIARYTLRVDGFVSVCAPYREGEFVTKPFVFDGDELVVNYSTSVVGYVRVEIQDDAGVAIPGHTLNEAIEIVGDEIERKVRWRAGTSVSRLAGKPIRLKFVMKDADLYSLRFVYNKRKRGLV